MKQYKQTINLLDPAFLHGLCISVDDSFPNASLSTEVNASRSMDELQARVLLYLTPARVRPGS